MKMKTLSAALCSALLLGTVTLATAQNVPSPAAKAVTPDKMENKSAGMSSAQYKAEKDRVEADAKAAKAACKGMKDNAKDICQAEAKGKEKLAKKELDYKKNPNDKNAVDVEKMKAEVAYELAKEKCEDQKGADAVSCKKQAKDMKDKAMADAKNYKRVASADTKPMSTAPSTMGTTGTKSTTGTGASMGGSASSANPSTGATNAGAGTSGTATPSQNKTGK